MLNTKYFAGGCILNNANFCYKPAGNCFQSQNCPIDPYATVNALGGGKP